MDYIRQLSLLDPARIGNKSITLVGAGATGSYVALALAQLGWGDTARGQGILRVFDGDKVEEHNLCNQAYEISHIGKPKVEALKEIILRKCGFEIDVHNEMVGEDSDRKLIQSNYVFILTDTMSSRKEIFEKYLQHSTRTDMVIETRMGLRGGRIYAFNPHSLDHKEEWTGTLYKDEAADDSSCGASASIVTTVMYVASLATQRVVQHFRMNDSQVDPEAESELPLWNEVQFTLYPEGYYMREFGQAPIMAQMMANAT
jgi:molybdopterin/thiamine biosynthesis adenylyltransferase